MHLFLKNMTDIFVNNITKNYGKTICLNHVSFIVPQNKITVLLGPSGAGKTTLLRILAGLDKDYSGNIEGMESPIAMIFQSDALFPHTKVKHNIAYGLQKLGYSKEEIDTMVLEISKLLHIEGLLDRYPVSLSGGEAKRVGIARALVRKPKVLLLDETFSSLDERLQEELQEELLRIQKVFHTTMILVSHNQKEALRLGNHLVLLTNGACLEEGTSEELYEDPKNLFTAEFLGNPRINLMNGVIQDGKVLIEDYEILSTNLESQVVQVGIRPETIHLAKEGLQASVLQSIYEGDTWIIMIHTKIGQLTFFNSERIDIDKKIYVSIDDSIILLFDQNGKRIV